MDTKKKKMSLTGRVILGMVMGIITGFIIRSVFSDVAFIHDYHCEWFI